MGSIMGADSAIGLIALSMSKSLKSAYNSLVDVRGYSTTSVICYSLCICAAYQINHPFMNPTYPLVPVCNVIAAVLVLLPLKQLFHAWNVGLCVLSVWLFLACLSMTVSTIVWKNNVDLVLPVFCDIGESCMFHSRFLVAINYPEKPQLCDSKLALTLQLRHAR
jgi:hypothetical protein